MNAINARRLSPLRASRLPNCDRPASLWSRLSTLRSTILQPEAKSTAQTEEQLERQLCASLKPGTKPIMLDQTDRMQLFLSAG
jgi:hypothetical protein